MQRQKTSHCHPTVEFGTNTKTQELKDILEKATSLTGEETSIIQAIIELSRGLKIEQ